MAMSKLNHELNRLATYVNWPSSAKASPIKLARNGFYYNGKGDLTICFRCSVCLENWQYSDDPVEKHRHKSSNCPMVLGKDTENVTIKQMPISRSNSPTVCNSGAGEDCTDNATSEKQHVTSDLKSVYQSAINRATSRGLFTEIVIDRNNPDFDGLRRESVRLSTYHDWPPRAHAQPRDLVKEGFFFTGIDDRVQCAFCRGFLRNWVPGDIPAEEHRKHFPECPFIRGVDVGNIYSDSVEQLPRFQPSNSRQLVELQETYIPETQTDSSRTNPQQPKHPEYKTEEHRKLSFRGGYVPRGQTIDVLAKAGFYYVGPHDNVRCFHCDGGLKNWQADDDPWVEHGRWFPRCAYLATQRDKMFIEASQVPRNLALNSNLTRTSNVHPLSNRTPPINDPLKTRIRQLYPDLVAEVEPRGYILDFLFQKEVLSMDCRTKLINIPTRQDRCRGLLEQILGGSHPQGCLMLREALKQHYPWIVQKIDEHMQIGTSTNSTTVSDSAQLSVEPREVKARMDSPTVRAIIDMGYSRDMIRQALERRLVVTGDDFPNAETLLKELFEFQELRPDQNPETANSRASSSYAANVTGTERTLNRTSESYALTGLTSQTQTSRNVVSSNHTMNATLPKTNAISSLSIGNAAGQQNHASRPKRHRKKKKVPTATLR